MFFGNNNKWVQRVWIFLVILITLGMLLFLVAPYFLAGTGGGAPGF